MEQHRCADGADRNRTGQRVSSAWYATAVLAALACAPAARDRASEAGPMLLRETPTAPFEMGPPLAPGSALSEALSAATRDAPARLVRLPVVFDRDDGALSFRTHVGGGADALEVRCDDSALGIALSDRVRSACGQSARCALWLEGTWRGEVGGVLTLAVRRVGDPIALDALERVTHAELETAP